MDRNGTILTGYARDGTLKSRVWGRAAREVRVKFRATCHAYRYDAEPPRRAPVGADTIGGQVPFNISNFPAMVALVQARRLRAIAVTSANRASQLPEQAVAHRRSHHGY
ncbi:MAG: hypothetical protein EXR29_14415 [Betaproteobacteria bacterium]|nr:hypothetical protein [Betaproteobacteria bacterium]